MNAPTVRDLLETFLRPDEHIPPIYPAIKIDGTPLYERARRGEHIEPPKRQVTVHAVELVDWESPVLSVDIDCSKGFYVRSFARDLGARAGTCAYLSNLVRTRVGPFDLCDAWTLNELADAPLAEEWERVAMAPDVTALSLGAVVIAHEKVIPWEQGKRWPLDEATLVGPVRVYDSAGNWLGIGEIAIELDRNELRPRKVVSHRLAGDEGIH